MLAGINRERGPACTHETDPEKSIPLFESNCRSWDNGRDTDDAGLDKRWRVEVISSDFHYVILRLLVMNFPWEVACIQSLPTSGHSHLAASITCPLAWRIISLRTRAET